MRVSSVYSFCCFFTTVAGGYEGIELYFQRMCNDPCWIFGDSHTSLHAQNLVILWSRLLKVLIYFTICNVLTYNYGRVNR